MRLRCWPSRTVIRGRARPHSHEEAVYAAALLTERLDADEAVEPIEGAHVPLMFGIIRRDPETDLVPPTTTRIPDKNSRAGTERTRLFTLLMTRPC